MAVHLLIWQASERTTVEDDAKAWHEAGWSAWCVRHRARFVIREPQFAKRDGPTIAT